MRPALCPRTCSASRVGIGVEGAADALLPVMADDVLSPNARWLRGGGWPGRGAMVLIARAVVARDRGLLHR